MTRRRHLQAGCCFFRASFKYRNDNVEVTLIGDEVINYTNYTQCRGLKSRILDNFRRQMGIDICFVHFGEKN